MTQRECAGCPVRCPCQCMGYIRDCAIESWPRKVKVSVRDVRSMPEEKRASLPPPRLLSSRRRLLTSSCFDVTECSKGARAIRGMTQSHRRWEMSPAALSELLSAHHTVGLHGNVTHHMISDIFGASFLLMGSMETAAQAYEHMNMVDIHLPKHRRKRCSGLPGRPRQLRPIHVDVERDMIALALSRLRSRVSFDVHRHPSHDLNVP